ncbi:hypothetical protein BCR42DRAFT_494264 [Absidia repens]|uniref:Uncharacterized protein n=1 Tax=Absidia repens TaxID=90262 RepID=A0A1X2I9I3_9FUNG|nr:hypothetical protein BCR42DRAFT_494264 [Absidia repens]
MQSRYYNELDHLRNASQRPQPSRSLDRSTESPVHPSSDVRTHTRTQSATNPTKGVSTHFDQKVKTTYFDRNGGGWLDPTSVQLTASRSSPSFPHPNSHQTANTAAIPTKTATTTITENEHTKEMLGAVSNEDILKLTHLTNQLPMVSRKHNHMQPGHNQAKPWQHLEEEDTLSTAAPEQQQQQQQQTSDMPNHSQITDTGFTDLLNQDFIKSSSPVSDTDFSAQQTIPSGNPSTISTDTDDSQFSWQNNSNSSRRYIKQPILPALPIDNQNATAEKTRHDHPLSITTATSPNHDSNLTPSSSQETRNNNRRSWYKSLMKRDKKGKSKYYDSALTNSNYDKSGNDTLDDRENIHHTLQNESTNVDAGREYMNNRSQTQPLMNTATNALVPPPAPARKRHAHLSIRRLRLSSKNRQSSTPPGFICDFPSSHKTNITRSNDITHESHAAVINTTNTKRADGKLRHFFYGRRHSFDNMREYDSVTDGTATRMDSRLDTTTESALSSISGIKGGNEHARTTPNSINMDHLDSHKPSSSAASSPRMPSFNLPFNQSSSSPRSKTFSLPPPTSSTTTTSSSYNATAALAIGISRPDMDDLSSIDGSSPQHDMTDQQYYHEMDNKTKHQLIPQVEYMDDTHMILDDTPNMSQLQHQLQQQKDSDQQQRPKRILYFDYHSLPRDNAYGEAMGIKGLVKAMIDKGYGTISERRIKPDDDDEEEYDDNNDNDDDYDDYDEEEQDDDDSTGADAYHDGDNTVDHGDLDQEYPKSPTDKKDENNAIPSIEASKVITGDAYSSWVNKKHLVNAKSKTRLIAEIHVDDDTDAELVTLTQLTDENSLLKGQLLNLHVSFLVSDKTENDLAGYIQDSNNLYKNVEDRLGSLDPFIANAEAFLNERKQQYRAFVPMDDSTSDPPQQQQRQLQQANPRKNSDSDSGHGVRFTTTNSSRSSSFSSLTTPSPKTQQSAVSSSTTTARPPSLASSHRSNSSAFQQSLWNYVPYQQYNAYEYRQDQLKDAVSDLRRGIDEFKRSLTDTEDLVHLVQIDMNDTKAKMDTYLKDVPETHYSELKRLEVSIESILANRAKSRGMELLYWLLTALLTGCAFLLWAVICVLKLGQTAISFPKKMIKAFNDHMEERNKIVKQAGMRIVAKGADRPPSVSSSSSRSSIVPLTMEEQDSATAFNQRPSSSRRRSSRRTSIPK